MSGISIEYFVEEKIFSKEYVRHFMKKNEWILKEAQKKLQERENANTNKASLGDVFGWLNVDEWANEKRLEKIVNKAKKVREDTDVFVLVGVGGSNNGARSVIKAFQKGEKPKIIFAGTNVSPHYMNQILQQLDGKSIYINVIAKNFETLEPGLCFRVLRNYLYECYGEEAYKRISVTGTRNSHLHQLAQKHGYEFFIFPENIGGRFSVLSDVGLFPMAVAGIDIYSLVQGAKEMQQRLANESVKNNIALEYATLRNLLLNNGYLVEMLAYFEPQFDYFAKWWVQLFAESEGKDGKGIFPTSLSYSEDLHSIGQYVQDGPSILFETFIDVEKQNSSLVLKNDYVDDKFDYVNDKDLWNINKVAFRATLEAHKNGGIPCIKFSVPMLNEFYFGQLFYLFMFSCYLSGRILGVNPFNQPGVEHYKQIMFKELGRSY